MGNSLFDQIKKSGLVDENKAKKVKHQKYTQAKSKKGAKTTAIDESKLRARKAQADKVEHDRKLNKLRDEAVQKKALAAQIRQLIEMNRLEDHEGEIAFNFTDDNTVQRLHVTQKIQEQIVHGRLAVVKQDGRYELIPAAVAEKIAQRDTSIILVRNNLPQDAVDDDDPYADYKVPDDLMW